MKKDVWKCVLVGDGAVGKRCLVVTYTKRKYPTDYLPTILDSYAASVFIKNEEFKLDLVVTAGQDDYDEIRKHAYPNTDVVLVCFSVDRESSFENVRAKWIPEVQRYCRGVPFIVVGTQMDRRNQDENVISQQQRERLAKELGAVKYLECSALMNINVDDVFVAVVKVALSVYGVNQTSKKSIKAISLHVNDKRTVNPPDDNQSCFCDTLCTVL